MATKEKLSAEQFLPKRRTLEGLRAAARSCKGCDLYKNATQTVFGEGVPLVAVGTFAEPFGRLKAAALASENGFSLGHGSYRRRSFELEKRPANSHHFNQL